MWRGVRNIRITTPDLLLELAVRLILLTVVRLLQIIFGQQLHHITENELFNDYYRRPRRDSYMPLWGILLLIIIIPLLAFTFPFILTRNRVDTVQAYLAWSLAMSLNAAITEMIKLLTCRPRPDFFYRCFPNGEVTKDLWCTGSVRDVIEGRKSFPSGHSSFSFCSMGFLSMWLYGYLGFLSSKSGQGLRVGICLIPLMAAASVALSRCCDNHHHWEDVIAGSIVGLICAYLCYIHYYHSLESELSGYSLFATELTELRETFPLLDSLSSLPAQTECSSRNLKDDVYLIRIKGDTIEANKKKK